MNNAYIRWFNDVRTSIAEYVGEKVIAEELIQYEVYANVFSCFGKDASEEDILSAVLAVLDSLNASDIYDIECWKVFYNDKERLHEFMKEYRISNDKRSDGIGPYWIKCIETMDEQCVANVIDILMECYVWLEPYCTVFTYQYLMKYPEKGMFDEFRLSILQYWEYRELANYVEKIEAYDLKEQVMKLSRCFCETDFDKKYPDRESLFEDLICKGIPMLKAAEIVKQISKGNGLSETMRTSMEMVGFDASTIEQINAIKYLKGRSTAIVKLLYTKELVV